MTLLICYTNYYGAHVFFFARAHSMLKPALTVRHIILYKTILLAHKAIHHDSPDYLASLLKLKLPTSTTTRSTNTFLLQLPPKHNFHETNTRAWAISVPYSWNTLSTLSWSGSVIFF